MELAGESFLSSIGVILYVYAHARIKKNESPHSGSCRVHSMAIERSEEREGQPPPCSVGHSLTFQCFHFCIIPFSFLCFLLATYRSISVSPQAGFGFTMASWD